MNVDWPLASELAAVFVVMSYVRWRWLKARMRRGNRAPDSPGPDADR